jgi:hypothetical protein
MQPESGSQEHLFHQCSLRRTVWSELAKPGSKANHREVIDSYGVPPLCEESIS